MIVLIAGMHRSGTSAMAGTLHKNGISMGNEKDFYPPPMKENPKGFYENKTFRCLNDKILNYNDYKVKSFNPYTVPNWDMQTGDILWEDMGHAVNYYNSEFKNWGWKDPRTCLTLWPWIRCLRYNNKDKNIKIILCYRYPGDIAKSMLRRGNKESIHDQFKILASTYYDRAMKALIMADIPFLPVNFDNLINDTENTFSKVSKYLNYELNDLSFIDSSVSKG